MESRGVNTDEFQRLKQRQAEQERLQQQHEKLSKQGATDGLRVRKSVAFSIHDFD